MSILKSLFGKKPITSTAIAAEIEKARAEQDAALAKRGAALAGLGLMDDAAHQKAEAEYEVHRRAADRAAARLAALDAAHAKALAAEVEAEKNAEEERFSQRIAAARRAVNIEAAELLAKYDQHAAAIADILARLNQIDAEAQACNETGRYISGFEAVRSTDVAHRKNPDRYASERREKRLCWVFRYPASPPDTERVSFHREAAREEVVQATISADTGRAIPVGPERYNYFGREIIIKPVLEEREIVLERTKFRAGGLEASLSDIMLPAGIAGGVRHWPR
ncbi:hypothetical protein [Bradyrhizobium sp. URHA0013]|uniref:hypothetical protein n=1 Tax=Bradyrhizobium sp. URHA0013 TaxID=1380352 RepID=UPI0004880EDF|nr:hypothetical protein [Bradyrhizobium sp. URHA0013]